MGIFGTSVHDTITEDVEKATDVNNTEEKWNLILNVCDKAAKSPEDSKACLRALYKRLFAQDPHIAVQAVTLLDACVKNCGKIFHLEIASREFETEYNKLLQKSHETVSKKLRECLRRWAENEFKSDPQLNLIPSMYNKLKNSGVDFSVSEPAVKKVAPISKDPNVVESQEEENQIMKAIELSLKETSGSPKSSASAPLYPSANLAAASTSSPPKEPKKVRALYDFEAAEDNELTFKSGEIICVIEDSDPNWWKGSNQRGEGLFPSNFVTKDLTVEPEVFLYEKAKKSVQFTEVEKAEEPENIEINEEKIDRLLHLLHEADPTNPETDTEEMLKLEKEVDKMGPLIDAELERVDRKHAQLTQLSTDLVEALSLYHTLMREPQFPPVNKMGYGYGPGPASLVGPPQGYNGLPPPQHQQPLPHSSVGMMGPPPGMPPPGHMHPHYATLPMMGLPPQMPPGMRAPPHSMGHMPPHPIADDRRMAGYGPSTMPHPNHQLPIHITAISQSMVNNGGPPQALAGQVPYPMPPPSASNPK